MKLVLDASVLIAATEIGDANHTRAQAIMAGAGSDAMVVHPLTLAEVLVGAVRAGAGAAFQQSVATAGVTCLSGDVIGPLEIATVRAESGLKIPDAVVLATAEALGGSLATLDGALADRAAARGVEVVG
ncbi:MAG: type II toxin-antitoxin system VapC family toxin [Bifidobacteriaceae bacterium]|jgi:predicted nucleic acid-binding protein|nr:type II toxin-antitoxin system VapC family toxin [Bifidobacteriaceae bacterium]